ncbi:unnamed protein product [Cuscuta campestris]|uniref:Uncharacterized protein n=1 Tax=Cuscuta campestris TaxID=132261 RepID=A0A484N4C9_9ASTE|nr:unnamed protein product [Cuscuta campestris]
MFEAWMVTNTQYSEGHNLTYAEFPGHFVYKRGCRAWFWKSVEKVVRHIVGDECHESSVCCVGENMGTIG